ncbi:MAG TPA: BlaI/MecI/CopY family transcriptional regulator [Streptomyces sp.]|nr:BlaI/MecI/CopY family transcriptional regulator [Streptomyces sp.]
MPPLMNQLPAPSKLELEILAVLWDQPSATGRAVDEALGAAGGLRRPIAYTTVKTYLDRLVHKGYVRGQPSEDGRGTYRYTALASREAVRDHPDLLARLVRVFRLTPAAFLRWCAVHGQLRPQDTAALRRLVHDLPEP